MIRSSSMINCHLKQATKPLSEPPTMVYSTRIIHRLQAQLSFFVTFSISEAFPNFTILQVEKILYKVATCCTAFYLICLQKPGS